MPPPGVNAIRVPLIDLRLALGTTECHQWWRSTVAESRSGGTCRRRIEDIEAVDRGRSLRAASCSALLPKVRRERLTRGAGTRSAAR